MSRDLFNGLLVLDKPAGMTSRDALDRALRWFPRRTRGGHTGTLDPLATGVLVLCLGSATRLAEYVQRMSKAYLSTFRLGARSDSDDADGVVTEQPGVTLPSRAEVELALAGFIGVIDQVPPAFSAVKVTGQRACDRVRQGQEVSLSARPVRVDGIDVLRLAYPELEVEVRCGKGTYIRSLARDLGERLGCGAYVQTLRRTRVGPFLAEEALTLDADAEQARVALRPASQALAELSVVNLDAPQVERFRRGQALPWGGESTGEVGVFHAGELVGVGRVEAGKGLLEPGKVLR